MSGIYDPLTFELFHVENDIFIFERHKAALLAGLNNFLYGLPLL
jgi:hypothetical protein